MKTPISQMEMSLIFYKNRVNELEQELENKSRLIQAQDDAIRAHRNLLRLSGVDIIQAKDELFRKVQQRTGLSFSKS